MRNKKGFSLIEIIVAMMIVGLVTTLATSLFIFGLQSYNTTIKQINQHNIIEEAIRRVGKDIQESSKFRVILPVDNSYSELYLQFPTTPAGISWRCWRIENKKLLLMVGSSNTYSDAEYAATTFSAILSDVDTGLTTTSGNTSINSRFQKIGDTLMVCLKPVSTNTTIHQNKNILNPITTEYSVKYKENIPNISY